MKLEKAIAFAMTLNEAHTVATEAGNKNDIGCFLTWSSEGLPGLNMKSFMERWSGGTPYSQWGYAIARGCVGHYAFNSPEPDAELARFLEEATDLTEQILEA